MIFVVPGERFESPWATAVVLGETVEKLTRKAVRLHTPEDGEPLLILAPVHPLWDEELTQSAFDTVNAGGRPCAGHGMICYPHAKSAEALERIHAEDFQWIFEAYRSIPFRFRQSKPVRDARSLSDAAQLLSRRRVEAHMEKGVVFLSPDTVMMGSSVKIGKGAVIYPNQVFEGKTLIGAGATVYPNCHLVNAVIGEGTAVRGSVIEDSSVGANSTVGPFAYLRAGVNAGERVRIGDFVEMKNARIGDDSCAAHLAYVGDAEVGKRVNIGCGVIFCNFDGHDKHMCTVHDDAFIGSDSVLIAPRTVGEGAYVAAGSAVTEDVEPGALYIARAHGVQKPGWAEKRRKQHDQS